MATISLTEMDKSRAEAAAQCSGYTCRVCQSADLLARDTAIAFGDGAVRVYMDCANNMDHETGVSVQSDPPPAPPRRRPGETFPRA